MFVKAPVSEAPVVVGYVQPTPVVESMANVCTTRSRCEVRDSSMYRCLSGSSDHIDSGADSLPYCDSADRHGANRRCDIVADDLRGASHQVAPATTQAVDRPVPVLPVMTQRASVEKPCQSITTVERLKSKFEFGHKGQTEKTVHARNWVDKNRWREKHEFEAKRKGPQYPQKSVEVPKVLYIDKVADIPMDTQRQVQVSTTQAAQCDTQLIDELVHIPATADRDWLERENKKRKFPDEADFESRALYVNIASGDEGEDGPEKEQEMTRSLVQGGEFVLMDEIDVQGPRLQDDPGDARRAGPRTVQVAKEVR